MSGAGLPATARMEQLLREALQPLELSIVDESHKHAGHAGVRERGGGHYQLHLVSARFEGLNPVARHRLVYQALSPMQQEIHALAMTTLTPAEAEARRGG